MGRKFYFVYRNIFRFGSPFSVGYKLLKVIFQTRRSEVLFLIFSMLACVLRKKISCFDCDIDIQKKSITGFSTVGCTKERRLLFSGAGFLFHF